MSGASPQFRAAADIAPSVFVSIVGDDTVDTSGAGDTAIGVMHESMWDTPIPGADGTIAVVAGESKRVYTEDEVCEVVTAATIAAGDKLAPDANGLAIVAVGAWSAIALSGAASGGRCKCVVTKGG